MGATRTSDSVKVAPALAALLRDLQSASPGCLLALRVPNSTDFLIASPDLETADLQRALQGEAVPGLRTLSWNLSGEPGTLFCAGPITEEALHSYASILSLFWSREELRQRQFWKVESLRSLLDHSLELITVLDAEGNLYYQTPSFRRLLSLPSGSTELNYLTWVHPEDIPLIRDCLMRVSAGESSLGPVEYRLRVPRDEELTEQFLESWFTQLATGAEGGAVVLHSRDITARKAAARALISRERRYRQVLDELHQAVFEMDLDLRLTFVNSSWERITGCRSQHSLGRKLEEFFAVGERPQVPLHREVYCRSGPHGPWWVELWLHPQRNGRGVLGLALDITERKLMQRQLDKMAQVVDQAVELVLLLDSYGRVTYTNPAYTRLTARNTEGLLWQPFFEMFKPLQPEGDSSILMQVIEQDLWTGKLVCPTEDGPELTLQAVISKVHDEQGEFREYLVTCRDITRETLLEEQLRVSQRLESLGLLAGGIAHDFNNLLQVIMANVALEQVQRAEDGEEPSTHLADVNEAAQRAQRLTRQLLTFASQQPIRSERVDLNELVEGTLGIVGRWFPAHTSYTFSPAAEPAWVEADSSQLEQVVLNLAVNARDAMPEGGRLTVSVHRLDGNWVLSFSDTGVGMSAAHRHRIFEPFFTTKGKEHGTGLGLSVVYGIVRRHKGTIKVQSVEGEGTTFTIVLPCADATSSPLPVRSSMPGRGGSSRTILVAEDEAMVRTLHAKVLEKHGFRVLLAKDGAEALDLFHLEPDTIDGILLDVAMPRMDGLELFRHIRKERADIPVLFCSAYLNTELLGEGEDEEVDYLHKPYEAQELVAKLQRLLSA